MSYQLRIKENAANFTKSDQKIAAYILENATEAVFFSAAELGRVTHTSQAAIMRFIKKINYNGLNELRIDMAKQHEEQLRPIMLVNQNASVSEIKNTMVSLLCETAKSTQSLNDDRVLANSLAMLRKAETLYLFGAGASGLVAEDFYSKLVRIHKRCIFDAKSDMQVMYSVHASPRDAYLAISYSGESKSVNMAVRQCRENGASGVAITRAKTSTLTRLTDMVIKIPNTEQDLRMGAMQSRYAELLMTDILFMGLVQERYEEVGSILKETRRVVKELNQ